MHAGGNDVDSSVVLVFFFFFFNCTATTEIYTRSLPDALPIYFSQTSPEAWVCWPSSSSRGLVVLHSG